MSKLNRKTANWMRMLLGTLAAVVLTVASGCMEATPGSDTAPSFTGSVADQSYTEGEAITALTLPSASGGEGTLSYSLQPTVPGLTFNSATRVLSGTPTTDGTYSMSYKVEPQRERRARRGRVAAGAQPLLVRCDHRCRAPGVRPDHRPERSGGPRCGAQGV